ncbi:ATP-binding protein [Auraticoccus monumenti]|uniref:Regulatory protein, luxR family n=1 Tax=Auraticoccus monumenti TaxID=675864 RepID=A0A1G6T327_9ACTN|nr:helix-turn-helix transcriptional regulator [Auraticoccus monumenti]SDD22867.1 regulatory protein, luxR family [Auraticoccus monumenti]
MPTDAYPLIGRDAQLAALTGEWEAAATGARLVLLGADAGGGKTTVVAELVSRLGDRAQVLVGHAVPLGGEGLAYVPVSRVLRGLTATVGTETVADWAGAGADTLGTVLPELGRGRELEHDRLRLFEAVTRVLERAAAEHPLLVVLEDLHWADEGTRQLVRFAVQALGGAPVLLVLTYRTDELHRRHPLRPFLAELQRLAVVSRVDLPRLDRFEVQAMAASRLGRQPSAELVERLHERSEGVPYFVAELTQALSGDCVELPDTLRDALLVRIGRMSEPAQALVRLMSTAGTSISHALLHEVAAADADDARTDALLREAVDAGVLSTTEDGYLFRHALLREVLHEDLLPGEHARTHIRFAEVLTARPDLGVVGAETELAHHWYAGHDLPRAFDAALAAARTASSPYERLAMLERVLELWDRVDHEGTGSRADVLEQAATLARRVGDARRGLPLVEAALAETDPATQPLVAACRLVLKGYLQGLSTDDLFRSYLDAIATTSEAVRLTDPFGATEERARALDALSTQLMLTGNLAPALETAREAERTAVAIGHDEMQASAVNTTGCVLVSQGEEEEGLATLRRSAPLSARNPWMEVRYHVNMSDALLTAGQAAESLEVAGRGVELARAQGISRAVGTMLAGNALEAALELGDWERAAELRRNGEVSASLGHHAVHLRLVGAWMDVWQGRPDAARAVLDLPGPTPSPAGRLPQYYRIWCTAKAELAWFDGDPARAWAELEPLLDNCGLMKQQDRWRLLCTAARSAAATGDPGTGARLLAMADGVRDDVAVAAWARPLLVAELDDEAGAWATTVDALAMGPVHLGAYARWRWASRLLADQRRAEAETPWRDALVVAERMGLAPLRRRLLELGRRGGLGTQPASGTLTPRETEVLRLVAEGRSNGEIAGELFISVKTVSVHVSNVLAKLSASSRGEAAAVARRRGLLD